MRVVLELAGVRNCFGKQLGSVNQLNNARATVEGLRALRTFKQARTVPHFLPPVARRIVLSCRRSMPCTGIIGMALWDVDA